jgi:hypothetical protein
MVNAATPGGHPTRDQQTLESWLAGCSTDQEERLLILDGIGWASDIDVWTTHGDEFLLNLGVDVLDQSYSYLSNDLRRCARVTGTPGTQPTGHQFDGEMFATGCPEAWNADVLAPTSGGEIIASYVNSHEGGADPVDCSDDANLPDWAAIIRKATGPSLCRRSVAMGISSVRLHSLNCNDQCLYEEWTLGGGPNSPAQLIADIFEWANMPIANPIGAPTESAPRLETRLIGSRPNPANPSATITFSLASAGQVRLRIYNVGGRLVRTLVDEQLEAVPEPYEVVWDGSGEAGRQVARSVYYLRLVAGDCVLQKKLVKTE